MSGTISAGTATPVSNRAWWGTAATLVAAAWSANQFAPLIVMYQADLGLSGSELDAMYAVYVVGLFPALLVGGRLSDVIGRRRVVVPAMVLCFAGTLALMVGGSQSAWLYPGRLVTGIGCGLGYGTATAWLKELSSATGDPGAGPRRATVSMTLGFAAGALVAGALAQWAPLPSLTAYLPNLVLLVVAVGAIRGVPDDGPRTPRQARDRSPVRSRRAWPARDLVTFFVPFAPWVFGTVAVFLAYLTPLVAPEVGDRALLFSAVAAGLGAWAGIAAQPLARVLDRPGTNLLVTGSMLLVVLGLSGATWAAHTRSPVLVLVDSVVLGAAYGVCQFCGLLRIQQVARPAALGSTIAAYQAVSYLGFAFPLVMAWFNEHAGVSPTTTLAAVTGLALVSAVLVVGPRTQPVVRRESDDVDDRRSPAVDRGTS